MASSKHYRMSLTGLSDQLFIPDKRDISQPSREFWRLTGSTAPPSLPADVATLHCCFKPLWVTMRVLGAFPITFTDKGIAVFEPRSRAYAYTTVLFVLTATLCTFVALHRINVIRTADFNTLIFSYKCILYCVCYWALPIGHLLGPGKIARYINKLSQFQSRVHEMTGTPLPLDIRRHVVIWTCALPLMVACLDVFEFFTLQAFVLYEAVFYGYVATFITYHLVTWSSMCVILMRASLHLTDMLTEELRAHTNDSSVVPKYRALWEELSHLTRETGNVLCYSYGCLLVNMFSILTCTTYGFLSESNWERISVREFGLGFNSLVVYIVLIIFCTTAHLAADAVDGRFLRRLKQLRSSDEQVQLQLEFFQIAIRLDSPSISLGGYVVVNRGLLITILAAIVTYLVVLLQFKVGAEPITGVSKGNNITIT